MKTYTNGFGGGSLWPYAARKRGLLMGLFLGVLFGVQATGQENATVEDPSTQLGCLKGDCETGAGTYRYRNGDVYRGQFSRGKRSDYGEMQYASGAHYAGNWVQDKREGEGTFRWPNGDRYTGTWQDNAMNGSGTLTGANGQSYTGRFEGGYLSGRGSFQWGDTLMYLGEFKRNQPVGDGAIIWNSSQDNALGTAGAVFGSFAAGQAKGIDTVRFDQPAGRFVGAFANGLYNGPGEYVQYGDNLSGLLADVATEGDTAWLVTGTWKGGKLSGPVRIGLPAYGWWIGETKEGQWSGTIDSLLWTQTHAEGDSLRTYQYRGEARAGKRHGLGTLTNSDGLSLKGNWQNGVPHGELFATYFLETSQYVEQKDNTLTFEGQWRRGRLAGPGRLTMTWVAGDDRLWLVELLGEWLNGEASGEGRFSVNRTQENYTGAFFRGECNGTGTYTWGWIGHRYTGQWRRNQPHGPGTYSFADGVRWEGRFDAGLPTEDCQCLSSTQEVLPQAECAAQALMVVSPYLQRLQQANLPVPPPLPPLPNIPAPPVLPPAY